MRDVRAVLLAGGVGARMGRLTRDRIKPMVPFAGQCHLVDFSLANAEDSGLPEVLLLSHHGEAGLIGYLLKTWERPGFRVHFGPHDRAVRDGADLAVRRPEHGTADALIANSEHIFTERYRDVLMLHADHVYRFDYRGMVEHHRRTGAALTIGYQEIAREYVSLFGMVEVDGVGRLTRFVEKPADPTSNLVFSAFCVFDRERLAGWLARLSGTDWQHDISRDVIPAMLAAGEHIATYRVDGYWADIGTEERYHREQLNVLGERPALPLAQVPRTYLPELPRTHVRAGEGLRDAVVPSDLVNHGHIEHSVIYPGVRVGAGAVVRDSIVLPGACVEPGATVIGEVVEGNP